MPSKKFLRLERKIERNERAAHPSYGTQRIHHIAAARAGEVHRLQVFRKKHHCNNCGILH